MSMCCGGGGSTTAGAIAEEKKKVSRILDNKQQKSKLLKGEKAPLSKSIPSSNKAIFIVDTRKISSSFSLLDWIT